MGEDGGAFSPGLAHLNHFPHAPLWVQTQKPRPLLGPSFWTIRWTQGDWQAGQKGAEGAIFSLCGLCVCVWWVVCACVRENGLTKRGGRASPNPFEAIIHSRLRLDGNAGVRMSATCFRKPLRGMMGVGGNRGIWLVCLRERWRCE